MPSSTGDAGVGVAVGAGVGVSVDVGASVGAGVDEVLVPDDVLAVFGTGPTTWTPTESLVTINSIVVEADIPSTGSVAVSVG